MNDKKKDKNIMNVLEAICKKMFRIVHSFIYFSIFNSRTISINWNAFAWQRVKIKKILMKWDFAVIHCMQRKLHLHFFAIIFHLWIFDYFYQWIWYLLTDTFKNIFPFKNTFSQFYMYFRASFDINYFVKQLQSICLVACLTCQYWD